MSVQDTPNDMPTTSDLDLDLLCAGIAAGNIPTLLCVLHQLTGEARWLEAPYLPSRSRGLDDNDDGGFPEEIQQEIRAAAQDAILAWLDGRPMALPAPSNEALINMLSVSMNEPVPDDYGEIIAAELDLAEHRKTPKVQFPDGMKALVIGAGVSGICAGINLDKMGLDFEIVEKNDDYGGTWWENRYPGAGVDTPNHIYSFSFQPNDWSQYFALQGVACLFQICGRPAQPAPQYTLWHARCGCQLA